MINEAISNYLVRHEAVLQHLVASAEIPAERIRSAMLYSLFPGGKRLRPLLIYLSGEILHTNQDCLDIIAAAVELTHCYSLIHDDLPAMDNDDLRRGKPSCHKAFDEATAILVGDGMQALAVEILLSHLPKSLDPSQVIAVTRELVVASGPAGMVSGQSLDLSELAHATITESQLRTIHSLKTEKLISACINMVIAASHSTTASAEALRDFGKHLGFVFQIQDDYLDHYAKTDLLGKGRASDLANQKITFASLYSKDELCNLINVHFQFAKDALIALGEQANDLLALTDYLHQRNNHL
ncbi:polyprenyl synthetase family protein [Legionella micdadei]|uniref:Farnesyl-diphosphate synthase n=1 Tax=Legionella micdadei TaxID=451 RepID=A0A098GDX5_LEGMI|nr:farnesyl diphosphate synthase [Legionella micdadei]ARG98159.1 geranyl transferase [Legionella micdadei]ARH00954.1 geranyl transferase [Legionella micdadei]KTD29933.1 geranyltranstransferase [Legionella micdadei]NSL19522.1 polyprenyl synthetase family protein [Legionella micdadei]CEG60185.1 Geranyltranstransferase [Legionella micdadei]